MKGALPWANKRYDKSWSKTLQMKKQTSPEKMCDGCPIEFIMFLNYSRGLRFDELPDYNYLDSQIRKLFNMSKTFSGHYLRIIFFLNDASSQIYLMVLISSQRFR